VNDGTKHQATIISSVISIDCMGVKQCHVYHPGKSSPFFVGWYKLTIPRKMGGKNGIVLPIWGFIQPIVDFHWISPSNAYGYIYILIAMFILGGSSHLVSGVYPLL
jgi:hypothetical protein